MAIRRHVVAAVLTAVVVAVALAGGVASNPGRGPGDASDHPSAPLTTTPSADGPRDFPDRSPNGSDAQRAASGRSPAPRGKTPSASSEADPDSPAGEVPGTVPTDYPELPGLGRDARMRRQSEAELARAFPGLQVKRGALAPRHPRRTVPAPPDAQVHSSSIATESGLTQVGLILGVPRSLERSLAFYRIRLGRVGFTEAGAPAVAPSSSAAFRRGPDRVVVAARRIGGSTLLTIHATLRTGG